MCSNRYAVADWRRSNRRRYHWFGLAVDGAVIVAQQVGVVAVGVVVEAVGQTDNLE